MKASNFAIIATLLITLSIFAASCSDDKQDKTETSTTDNALKNLDAANQANRANQTIPNMPPQITILSPSSGAEVTTSPLKVSWTASDQNGDQLMVGVQYREIVTNAEPGAYVQALAPVTPDPKEFNFDISALKVNSNYELMITASDGSLSNVAYTRFIKK